MTTIKYIKQLNCLDFWRCKTYIYTEVEIPVTSNLKPLSDKALVTFNLVLIMVFSDNYVYYFMLGLK